jgi:hypothetical protein
MNPIILTKISKFLLIASTSSFISFAASFHPGAQIILGITLAGSTFIVITAVLWEGRESLSTLPSEEGLSSILSSMNSSKPKKNYLLSPGTRLEVVIGLIVVLLAALVGSL